MYYLLFRLVSYFLYANRINRQKQIVLHCGALGERMYRAQAHPQRELTIGFISIMWQHTKGCLSKRNEDAAQPNKPCLTSINNCTHYGFLRWANSFGIISKLALNIEQQIRLLWKRYYCGVKLTLNLHVNIKQTNLFHNHGKDTIWSSFFIQLYQGFEQA